jgi:hypothetical protein
MEKVPVNVVDITYGNNSDTTTIVLCTYHLCKRPVQSAETGGPLGKQAHNPGDDYGFASAVNGSLATREFQVLSIPLEKGRRLSGKQVVMLMNENLGACTVRHKNCTTLHVGQHRDVELNINGVTLNIRL